MTNTLQNVYHLIVILPVDMPHCGGLLRKDNFQSLLFYELYFGSFREREVSLRESGGGRVLYPALP